MLSSAVGVECLGPLGAGHDILDPVLPGGDPGVDPGDVGLGALVAVAHHPDHSEAAAALRDGQGPPGVSLAGVLAGVHRTDVDAKVVLKSVH